MLLNFWRDVCKNFVTGLPALPAPWQANLDSIHSASISVAGKIDALGVLIPFDAIRFILGFLPVLLAFWLTMTAIRVSTKRFVG